MKPVIIIPTRLASKRLPHKPLIDIHGVPMIVRTWQKAMEACLGTVIVACADQEVADVIHAAGGQAVLTDPELPSGTDRVAEALRSIDPHHRFNMVINLHGDFPLLRPELLKHALIPFEDDPYSDVSVTTLACPLKDIEAIKNPLHIKTVVSWQTHRRSAVRIGRAMYFTRSPAPWGEGENHQQIGLYAWRREALMHFTDIPPTSLEIRERIDLLRALENQINVAVIEVQEQPFSIDTPEDLAYVKRLMV